MADLIRGDQIDILLDLSMHTGCNRLLVFARKPAPVQVCWLAYPGSTGLETIDYRLSDPYLDPPGAGGGEEPFYSEETIRLPETFWCYHQSIATPEVGPLPPSWTAGPHHVRLPEQFLQGHGAGAGGVGETFGRGAELAAVAARAGGQSSRAGAGALGAGGDRSRAGGVLGFFADGAVF